MSIRQLTIHGTLQGQDINNVYYFDTPTDLGASCPDLVEQWFTNVLPPLEATLAASLHMDRAKCVNLDNPDDWLETAMDSPGSISADPLPPFVTATYIYNRTSRAVHNGFKRFAGIPETATPDGVTITSAYVILANDLASALGSTLHGVLQGYIPIIFHKTSAAGAPLAGTPFSISSVSFDKIGSQLSRKIGHGG